MTKSLSNVIKAYAIRYDEKEKRTLDVTERAEAIARRYIQQQSVETSGGTGEFIAGIPGLTMVEQIPEPPVVDTAQLEAEKEEALRQEITAQIEQQVQEEVDAILINAQMQAEQIKNQAIEEANQLKSQLMKKASDDGYAAGMKKAEKDLQAEKAKLHQRQQDLEEIYARQISELEPAFGNVLIALLQKLTGFLLDKKKGIVFYLISQAMQNCEKSNMYLLKVSKEDYAEVEQGKQTLLDLFERPVQIETMIDPLLKKGECFIETDSRVIDCSLGVQLEGLIEDIQLFTIMEQ